MNKIFKIVVIYIALLVILAIFGIIGDSSKESLNFALKYFTQQDIDTGRNFFLYGLITSTAYHIVAILFLFHISHNIYWTRFSQWLLQNIKSTYLIIFFSFIAVFAFLAFIRFPFSFFMFPI